MRVPPSLPRLSLAILLALTSLISDKARSQCTPTWSDEFPRTDFPLSSSGNNVSSSAAFDPDGDGPLEPVLYVGGPFSELGGTVAGLAEWTPHGWRAPVGAPSTFSAILSVLDADGDGPGSPALFASGSFNSLQTKVVRFDGTAWTSMAFPFNLSTPILTVHDPQDGSGPSLYGAAIVNDTPRVLNIWRWTNPSWTTVASLSGFSAGTFVRALASFDEDGTGPRPPTLFVAGNSGFFNAGASHILRWDGQSWSGVPGYAPSGGALGVTFTGVADPDGPGPREHELIFGSDRDTPRVYAWSGSTLSTLATGLAYGMTEVDHDGDGPEPTHLYFAGARTLTEVSSTGVTTLDPWQYYGEIRTITAWDPDGPAGPKRANAVAGMMKFDGLEWSALSVGPSWYVNDLLVFDDDGPGPDAPALYAAHVGISIGARFTGCIARFDGSAWSGRIRLTNFAGVSPIIQRIVAFDPDGDGPEINQMIALGGFTGIDGVSAQNIARRIENTWFPLGSGLPSPARNAIVFDFDGPGPRPPGLVVATGTGVLAWDGTAWESLPGLEGLVAGLGVQTLAAHDADGDGPGVPQLFAGGGFTGASGSPAPCLAKWNGTAFVPVPGAAVARLPGGIVYGLVSFDADEAGPQPPRLYIGGTALNAETGPLGTFARLEGNSFVPIAGSPTNIRVLTPVDDGAGPVIYVSGSAVRRFDGAFWSDPPGGGFATCWRWLGQSCSVTVTGAVPFDRDGEGPRPSEIFFGGSFLTASGVPSQYLAAMTPAVAPVILNLPPTVAGSRGGSVTFAAEVAGGGPALLQWRRGSDPLPDGPTSTGSVIAGAGTATLTISNLAPADDGVYTLHATNGCGQSTSSPVLLTVHPACAADADGSGEIGVGDIFAFLDDWFAQHPRADFDRDTNVSLDDLFGFLALWFGGC